MHQDRCSALEAYVNKNVQNISEEMWVFQLTIQCKRMWLQLLKQPVFSVSKAECTLDTVDLIKKNSGSCQEVSSDLETDSSGEEKRSFSAVITPSKVDDYRS